MSSRLFSHQPPLILFNGAHLQLGDRHVDPSSVLPGYPTLNAEVDHLSYLDDGFWLSLAGCVNSQTKQPGQGLVLN